MRYPEELPLVEIHVWDHINGDYTFKSPIIATLIDGRILVSDHSHLCIANMETKGQWDIDEDPPKQLYNLYKDHPILKQDWYHNKNLPVEYPLLSDDQFEEEYLKLMDSNHQIPSYEFCLTFDHRIGFLPEPGGDSQEYENWETAFGDACGCGETAMHHIHPFTWLNIYNKILEQYPNNDINEVILEVVANTLLAQEDKLEI